MNRVERSYPAAPEPGALLAVLSDTHGHVPNARRAVRLLESLRPAAVIHCGDIGSPEVVRLLDRWPSHFVFGNVDGELDLLRAAIGQGGQTCHERFGQLELAGRRIAFLHGDDTRRLDEAIAGDHWDLVCHGHTHVARLERRGATLVLNPGALFRARVHSIAVVDLDNMAATIVPVD